MTRIAKSSTAAAWTMDPEIILCRLRSLVERKDAVAVKVPPMSDGWMRKKGYLPTTSRLGIWLRIEAVKRRVRRGDGRG